MSLIDKEPEEKDIEYYQTIGSIRYIAFIQEDGTRLSLPYSLLPIFEFEPGEEYNIITITFPSHTITLTGYCLEQLCKGLENEKIRTIKISDKRYEELETKSEYIVVSISIKKERDNPL